MKDFIVEKKRQKKKQCVAEQQQEPKHCNEIKAKQVQLLQQNYNK